MTTAPSFSLDDSIDAEVLARAFAERGWVQIAPFLKPEDAERVREDIEAREAWTLSLLAGSERVANFPPQLRAAMREPQRLALERLAAPPEGKAVHYLYERIMLVTGAGEKVAEEEATPLGGFARFLSSEPVLDLLRIVTGQDAVGYAQAQATRLAGGHFICVHNDREEEAARLAAYVYNLTPEWRPEWGGMLLFHDDKRDVEHGLVPRMNALNLFAVPRRHSVGIVAPFAPRPRYAVTGWLRPNPS